MPAGSNMPDRRCGSHRRAEPRSARPRSTLVVSAFGMTHPQQLVGHADRPHSRSMLDDGHGIVFVSLGHAPDAFADRTPAV